jgi:tetratricopeptide (TPR) repeat protein
VSTRGRCATTSHRGDRTRAQGESGVRDLLFLLADLYLKRGRTDDAIARLAPLVAAEPNLLQARILLGVAYLAKFDTVEAIKQFTQVNEANPNVAVSHHLLGAPCCCVAMPRAPVANTRRPSSWTRRRNR